MNDITNIGVTNFFKSEVLKIEIKIAIIRARKVKVKCLEKNNNLYLNVLPQVRK